MNNIPYLTHKHMGLWLDSGILSNLIDTEGNPKTLKDILEEVKKFALTKAMQETGLSKKEVRSSEIYKDTFGWMGETLALFWIITFGHRYDLTDINDTSHDKFQRGFDLVAKVIIDTTLSALIQIKMQSEDRAFTYRSLFTFFDETKKNGILPRYTILVVPTAESSKEEMLSWKENFKKEYSSQLIFIGASEMDRQILSLPTRIQGENPNLEFFIRFRECLNNSCKYLNKGLK